MRCIPARDFNVSKAMAWRSAIADDPPYQRESSIWSLEKQQLFIDSLLNGYDVPKVYLHDLRGKHPTKVYAVVDGKQRLSTIWRYLADEFPLANDFRIEPTNLPELPPDVRQPGANAYFSELDPAWQHVLRRTHLAVVLIQNATEMDIEDLFSRLNNGEPLNGAEKRNAMGGDAMRMIREIANHDLFATRARFARARYQHHDAAARILLIESATAGGADVPDLRSRSLDTFVHANRKLPRAWRQDLLSRVDRHLDRMSEVFEKEDPLLSSQATPALYYLLVRLIDAEQPIGWAAKVREFLDAFQADRRAQLQRVEDEQEPMLREFSDLMHSGANEARNIARRLEILMERFRRDQPEISVASSFDAP